MNPILSLYVRFVVNIWPESNKVLFCSVLLGIRRVLETVFNYLVHSHSDTKESPNRLQAYGIFISLDLDN